MSKEEFIIKVKELGLVLTDKELHSLDRYYQILKEENSKYNLTRIIEEEEVYLKHFYDSLTITKVVNIDNQSISWFSISNMFSKCQINFNRSKW